MDEKITQEFGRKIQAAQVLGCEINQLYKEVEKQMFAIIQITKNGVLIDSLSVPVKKEEVLAGLQGTKANLIQQQESIDAEIAKVAAVKPKAIEG